MADHNVGLMDPQVISCIKMIGDLVRVLLEIVLIIVLFRVMLAIEKAVKVYDRSVPQQPAAKAPNNAPSPEPRP